MDPSATPVMHPSCIVLKEQNVHSSYSNPKEFNKGAKSKVCPEVKKTHGIVNRLLHSFLKELEDHS